MAFSSLPTELVLGIFERAACANVANNRLWVVQLALVSNTGYEIVRPFLYHTLIITGQNYKYFQHEPSHDRILPFVRSMSVFVNGPNFAHYDLRQYLTRWTPPGNAHAHFDVPWPIGHDILDHLQDLHSTPLCLISSILVRYELLHHAILQAFTTSMPAPIAKNLKQIGGYVPDRGEWYTTPDSESSSPKEWGQAILDSLPALRHIMFRVVDIGYFDDYTDEMKGYLLEVCEMVRSIFEHRPSLKVTILFGGDYTHCEVEVRTLLESLNLQGTLNAWFDRRTTSWTAVNAADPEDGWSERDTWSSPPPEPSSVLPRTYDSN